MLPASKSKEIKSGGYTRTKAKGTQRAFFFFLIFTEVWLLYNVVLVSAVQQSESAIRIHISPLFWISFPFRSPQSTE